jgi:hypothetical protein
MPCHAGRTISGALRQPIGQSATGPKLLEQARDVVAARPAACAALDAGHRQLADVRRSFRRWASGQLSGKWPVAVVAQGCTLGNLPSLKRCPLSCFDPEICAIGRPPKLLPIPHHQTTPAAGGLALSTKAEPRLHRRTHPQFMLRRGTAGTSRRASARRSRACCGSLSHSQTTPTK